ncbi:MAG: NifB/NifX family molybdenum-iron cluster-binding protein [Polyangiaceae bacterium]
MSDPCIKVHSSADATRAEATIAKDLRCDDESANRSRSPRVALATSTGEFVDQHFATASRFRIYEFNEGQWFHIGDRENPDCRCGCSGPSGCDATTFSGPLSILTDVDLVVVNRIGAAGASALLDRGIRGQLATGPITEILAHLEHSPKLKHPLRRKGWTA